MNGDSLRAYRRRRGLSQDELAAILNKRFGRSYDKAKVSRWENGRESLPEPVIAFLNSGTNGRCRIVAVALQKGGSTKTTTTINLGYALARMGFRVLLVDADPQATLTQGLGLDVVEIEQRGRSLYNVLESGMAARDVVLPVRGLDVLPSGISLARFEVTALSKVSHEKRLKAALAEMLSDYDFVLIDTPPNLNVMTKNALVAAGEVLIPVVTAPFDVLGIPLVLDTIAEIRRYENPALEVLGILPTRFNRRQVVDQTVLKQLTQQFAGPIRVFEPVHEATGFKQAAFNGDVPIDVLPADHPAQAYVRIAREIAGHEA